MTTTIPVPRSFDEVTAEWLTAVLSIDNPGVVVTSMGHKPNKARSM
jgi:hypothetical protein